MTILELLRQRRDRTRAMAIDLTKIEGGHVYVQNALEQAASAELLYMIAKQYKGDPRMSEKEFP